jgi:integrase
MASAIFDRRRGVWSVQWFDGRRRTRAKVYTMPRWRPGDPKPARTPIEVDRALVEYRERELAARGGYRADPEQTVREFLAAYRAGYAPTRRPGTVAEFDRAAAALLAWLDARGVARLAEVTPAACRAWVAGQVAAGDAPATVRKRRALVAGAWGQAVADGAIDRNPWSSARPPERAARVRRPSWSPEEYRQVLEAARPWLRDVIALGCHCGLRIEALLGLEWRDIHWSAGELGEVEVRPELDKAGKGYRVPLHAVAHDLLARRRADAGKAADRDRVLTGQAGRPSNRTITARAIGRACRRAGLEPPRSPNHCMRRTFGRWAVLGHLTGRPVPLYVVARWLGHSSTQMTEAYLDVRRDESAGWMSGGE